MYINVAFNRCINGDLEITELLVSHRVGGNRKRNQQSTNADQKSIETVFFDCHLSPGGRQMAIKNAVSIDF